MSDSNDPIFDHERVDVGPDHVFQPDLAVPIVVGAHPRAEISDRPWASRLARRLRGVLRSRGHDLRSGPFPLVMTDVWYLNDDQLRLQPTIAVGEPAVNAVSAMFATKLPCAFAIDEVCQVLLDPELLEPRGALWGVTDEGTHAAMERFELKWMEEFVDAIEHVYDA